MVESSLNQKPKGKIKPDQNSNGMEGLEWSEWDGVGSKMESEWDESKERKMIDGMNEWENGMNTCGIGWMLSGMNGK